MEIVQGIHPIGDKTAGHYVCAEMPFYEFSVKNLMPFAPVTSISYKMDVFPLQTLGFPPQIPKFWPNFFAKFARKEGTKGKFCAPPPLQI